MPAQVFTGFDSDNRTITYKRPDGTSRTLTLLDAPGQETDEDVAAAFQSVIQNDYDEEINLADLPVDDPEHRDNFQNANLVRDFLFDTYGTRVFLDVRPGNEWWRITREVVVSVVWDAVNGVYQTKTSVPS